MSTLLYLEEWLLHSPSKDGVANNILVVLGVLADMGFIVDMGKSAFTPMQQLDWLWIRWNTTTANLSLAPDNVF